MNKRNVLILLVICALAATGIVFVLSSTPEKTAADQPGKGKQPPLVRTITASTEIMSSGLALTGSVEPYRVARLASPAEGPVADIRVREGDHVKTGAAMLFIGRKKGVDALIASLREELKQEEDNLKRTRRLCEIEALPGEQLDQAVTAYEKVRAQLAEAEETAGDYGVTAPWPGVVSHVLVKEGEFAAPRAVLLEMYDPDSLVILAGVPEKYAAAVRTEMPVEVKLDAYPDEVLQGRIARVYPRLDSRLRTRTVEIALDKQIDLLPGMFARLKIRLKQIDDAISVPSEALVTTPKGREVFVVEEGRALARPVKTGIEEGNRIQIVTGVETGDKVIVAGNEKLKDGAGVRLAEAQPGPSAVEKKKAGEDR